MREELKFFALATGIIALHFASAYFAIYPMFPFLAPHAGFTAAILAALWYLFLWFTGNDEAGLPVGLLIILPVIYIAGGIIWWIMRLIGVWPLPR